MQGMPDMTDPTGNSDSRMEEMPETVYFEFVTGDFGCRIKRWQRSPFDGCQEYTRSDLSDQRIAALEEKLAMAEKALRHAVVIISGMRLEHKNTLEKAVDIMHEYGYNTDTADRMMEAFDFRFKDKVEGLQITLSAISAKDGEK